MADCIFSIMGHLFPIVLWKRRGDFLKVYIKIFGDAISEYERYHLGQGWVYNNMQQKKKMGRYPNPSLI